MPKDFRELTCDYVYGHDRDGREIYLYEDSDGPCYVVRRGRWFRPEPDAVIRRNHDTCPVLWGRPGTWVQALNRQQAEECMARIGVKGPIGEYGQGHPDEGFVWLLDGGRFNLSTREMFEWSEGAHKFDTNDRCKPCWGDGRDRSRPSYLEGGGCFHLTLCADCEGTGRVGRVGRLR